MKSKILARRSAIQHNVAMPTVRNIKHCGLTVR